MIPFIPVDVTCFVAVFIDGQGTFVSITGKMSTGVTLPPEVMASTEPENERMLEAITLSDGRYFRATSNLMCKLWLCVFTFFGISSLGKAGFGWRWLLHWLPAIWLFLIWQLFGSS